MMYPMSGIPGLRGTDHIGITVPDLDEAERWFIDVLGAVHVYTLTTVDPRGNESAPSAPAEVRTQ